MMLGILQNNTLVSDPRAFEVEREKKKAKKTQSTWN
jgi:hypothetical protein